MSLAAPVFKELCRVIAGIPSDENMVMSVDLHLDGRNVPSLFVEVTVCDERGQPKVKDDCIVTRRVEYGIWKDDRGELTAWLLAPNPKFWKELEADFEATRARLHASIDRSFAAIADDAAAAFRDLRRHVVVEITVIERLFGFPPDVVEACGLKDSMRMMANAENFTAAMGEAMRWVEELAKEEPHGMAERLA